MFHTFERELIANHRHEDLLRSAMRRLRSERPIDASRTKGTIARLNDRLRGTGPVRRAAIRA